MEKQEDLERSSVDIGYVRQGNLSSNVDTLLQVCSPMLSKRFVDNLGAYFERSYGGRASIKDEILELLEVMSVQELACLTARACIIGALEEQSATSVAFTVFNDVELQKQFRLSSSSTHRTKTLQRMLGTKSSSTRKKVLNSLSPIPKVSRVAKANVGSALVSLFIQSQDVIKTRLKYLCHNKTMYVLGLTEDGKALREFLDDKALPLYFRYYPMVEVPKDWNKGNDGGYAYALSGEFFLVKSRATSPIRQHEDYSYIVSEGVNRLQRVPFRVNKEILEVASAVYDRFGGGICGLPERDPKPCMPYRDIPYEELNMAQKAERNFFKENEAMSRGQRISVELRLMFARKFKDYPQLFFPMQLDSRGRVYPIPATLSPQGDDLSKALLSFAHTETEPMGDEGERWFWIQGANTMGHDKLPFDQRVEVAKAHVETHLHVADDPLAYIEHWKDLDEPFQYLSWAMSLRDMIDSGIELRDYPCSHCISVDGSCNGFQHFAALLRDPVTARAVNMTNLDRPSDIYSEVVGVLQRVNAGYMMDEDSLVRYYASVWAPLINRSLVKRAVMTTPYGVTLRGVLEQLLDYLKSNPVITYDSIHTGDSRATYVGAVQYLSERLNESIRTLSQSASCVMEFLRDIARKHGEQWISWTLPSGFRASQHYPAHTKKRIQTWLGTLQICIDNPSDKMYSRKQIQGISPNFVHSLDAEHLRRTVCAMPQGTPLWMIHDSYGTTPGRVPLLARTLRREFVDMYNDFDYLEYLRDRFGMDEVPTRGDFDITEVLNAEYFFS